MLNKDRRSILTRKPLISCKSQIPQSRRENIPASSKGGGGGGGGGGGDGGGGGGGFPGQFDNATDHSE